MKKTLSTIITIAGLVILELTEAPFRGLLTEFGFFVPDGLKAAQCVAVSHHLPDEAEALVWSDAAYPKIWEWVINESGCKTKRDCVMRQVSLVNLAEQKAHPDGGNLSHEILRKWRDSDYCQEVVASYKEGSLENLTPEASKPAEELTAQPLNAENDSDFIAEAAKEATSDYMAKWEFAQSNPEAFIDECKSHNPSQQNETECRSLLDQLTTCMSKPESKPENCFVEVFESGD